MASAAQKLNFTPEAYLASERRSPFKSEYHDGQIHAMSGASRAHNLLAANLSRHLGNQLAGRGCEVYINDMRVRVQATGSYSYPDIVVVCEEPRFEDQVFDTLWNSAVIVEILSHSTEDIDRGRKLHDYRRIASLQDYLLISQDQILVEHHTRQGDDWILTIHDQPANVLRLASVGAEVGLREIYHKIPRIEVGD